MILVTEEPQNRAEGNISLLYVLLKKGVLLNMRSSTLMPVCPGFVLRGLKYIKNIVVGLFCDGTLTANTAHP